MIGKETKKEWKNFRFNGPSPRRYMLAKSPLIPSSELEPAKILG